MAPWSSGSGWNRSDGWNSGAGGGSGVGGYQGVGDIAASGIIAYYGIRAYSAATIGTACIRLQRSSDTTQKDIVTAASGIVDVSDTFFDGSTTYDVIKLYDQTGNSRHIDLIVTLGAVLTLGDNGPLPTITVNSGELKTNTTLATISAKPFSVFAVSRRTFVSQATICSLEGDDNQAQMLFASSSGFVGLYDFASLPTAAATEGNTHALGAVFNGASSVISVNGTNNTVNVGGAVPPGTNTKLHFPSGFSGSLTGKSWEFAAWSNDQSSNFAAISTQAHTVWNF